MNEKNIYNHQLALDVFCMDIIEGWMNWQKNNWKAYYK